MQLNKACFFKIALVFFLSVCVGNAHSFEKMDVEILKQKTRLGVSEELSDGTYFYYEDIAKGFIVRIDKGGAGHHILKRYDANGMLRQSTEKVGMLFIMVEKYYDDTGKLISDKRFITDAWANKLITIAKERYGFDILGMDFLKLPLPNLRSANINGKDVIMVRNAKLGSLSKKDKDEKSMFGEYFAFLDGDTLEEIGTGYVEYYSNPINLYLSHRVYMNGRLVIDRFRPKD